MRILIADDDLTARTVLGAVLGKSGHEVMVTADGAEAWQALQQPDAPALAILDWMMPGMDGPEVVRRVRARVTQRPPYLIILTARGEKADIIAGLAAGADDYLAKAFEPEELLARVEVGRRTVELQAALADKNDELGRALEQVKTLKGILPICASCKMVRDDAGYWTQVEAYVSAHTEGSVQPRSLPAVHGEALPRVCP